MERLSLFRLSFIIESTIRTILFHHKWNDSPPKLEEHSRQSRAKKMHGTQAYSLRL